MQLARLLNKNIGYFVRGTRWLTQRELFIAVSLLMLYTIITLWKLKPGLYIKCPCLEEVETEERVGRYLPSLMDERNPITNRTAMAEAEFEHQSLPVHFLVGLEASGRRCVPLPGLFDIKHRDDVWQEAQVGSSTFLLFSAFIDQRDERDGPLIRILAMADSGWPSTPTCHLHNAISPEATPLATRALRVEYIHWQYPIRGNWQPFLITCRAGLANTSLPEVVSIVESPCSPPTNALRVVHYDINKKKNKMALCHKFLFNPSKDFSLRLIEWLEMARAWGIDQVTFYVAATHPNVIKVLKFYEKINFVKMFSWKNPSGQPNVPSLLRALYDTQRYTLFTDENIPYTDCLLRHIGTHQYVGVWDVDEFVFPTQAQSIPAMIDQAYTNWKVAHQNDPSSQPPTSYLTRSSYFFDDNVDVSKLEELFNDHTEIFHEESHILAKNMDMSQIQKYFSMLSHTIRTIKFSPPAVFTKSIHDTSRALGLHAHFALYNIDGVIDREKDLYHVYPNSEGFLGHFREKCQGENQTECEEYYRPYVIEDTTLWKHSEEVISSSLRVIRELDLT